MSQMTCVNKGKSWAQDLGFLVQFGAFYSVLPQGYSNSNLFLEVSPVALRPSLFTGHSNRTGRICLPSNRICFLAVLGAMTLVSLGGTLTVLTRCVVGLLSDSASKTPGTCLFCRIYSGFSLLKYQRICRWRGGGCPGSLGARS